MSNQWAQRKAAQKKDSMESYSSLMKLNREMVAQPRGIQRKREVNERPATAARRERTALYGKFSPANDICCKCFTIKSASGACAGACFD